MATLSHPILVVDDNDANRELLCRRLRSRGYPVATASGGREALDYLLAHEAAMVLLDIEMPGLNGLDVLHSIRETWTAARLPVVIVTARTRSEDIVEALDLGADDYITKPIDFAVTLARIRTQLARKDAEDRLRASEERYALAALGARDGLWDWDLTTDRIYFSKQWKTIIGYDETEFGDDPEAWLSQVHPDDLPQLRRDLDAHLAGRIPHFESEHRVRHRSGEYLWVLTRGLAVRDAQGRAVRMAGSQSQVSAGKVVDSLTGLPNRALLTDRLSRLLESHRAGTRTPFALLFIDLDGLKQINDSLGHLHGDALLRGVARRLEDAVRPTDVISRLAPETAAPESPDEITTARLGGDEFIVLLHGVRSVADATRVAERIQRALSAALVVNGRDVFVTASIGIALSETGYDTPDEVLRDADTAMYRAKTLGKGRIEVFDNGLRGQVVAH